MASFKGIKGQDIEISRSPTRNYPGTRNFAYGTGRRKVSLRHCVLWIIRPHPSTLLVSTLLAALIHFRTVESPLFSALIPPRESKEIRVVTLHENTPRRPMAECRSSKLYCTKVPHAVFGKRRKPATARSLACTRSTAIIQFFGICQSFLRFIDEEARKRGEVI